MKKALSLILSLTFIVLAFSCMAVCVSADDTPVFKLTTLTKDIKVGDEVEVVLSVENGATLCSGELWIEYNPYAFVYLGGETSKAAAGESGLVLMFDDENESREVQYAPDGKTLKSGTPVYFIHVTEFSENLNNADLCTLRFLAIGGGDIRFQFTAHDVEKIVDGNEVDPVGVKCVADDINVPVEGESASEWDYDVSVPEDVAVPDQNKTNSKMIIIIVIVAVIIIGAIIALVMAIKQNGLKDDDDEEDGSQKGQKESE